MSKSSSHEDFVNLVIQQAHADLPISEEEREAIIQDVIATQRIEGIEVSYAMVAEVVDEVFSEPVPVIK